MNGITKKITAIAVIALIVLGGILTVRGIGPVDPLKDQIKLGLDIKGGVYVVMEAQTDLTGEALKNLMDQTRAVIEERVDQMGLANPVVTIEGEKRIRVELPGAEDAEEAIAQIGKTAQLKFTMADGSFVLDGSSVRDAVTQQDTQKGGYAVGLKFDSEGAKAFEQATIKALSGKIIPTIPGTYSDSIVIFLDGQVISSPSVEEVISGGECEISGRFSQDQATNLAALIRGGALPVELQEVTSSVQTAKIGLNAFEMSIYAGMIGFGIIFLIMLVGYRILGVAANIALCLYLLLILGAMAAMGSVLTLPGIAGIILSVGMAVDANIIIFSRIREEITQGKSIRVATHTGFRRAMSTIVDSQITTLIAAVILYQVGTSAVKGFAWTLMIGILASIITAVLVTQLFISIIVDSPRLSKMSYFGMHEDGTPKLRIKRQFHFIRHRKIFYMISIAIIAIGLLVGGIRGFNYGIDFTGGTMIHIDMGKQVATSEIKDVFSGYDVDTGQMEIVYSGDSRQEVIIKTREALDNDIRVEIINDFEEKYGISDEDVLGVELFGPSVGKELQSNAIKAVLLAALGMLLYIRIRFREWKFGGAALVGVLHDVLMVIAFYAIFRVTVNNPFIAGILTVVGYSINDTIVVFDRVRENLKFMKKDSTETILDTSINQTLVRSIMTSATTVVVMIPLYFMTSSAIREFALPLMVGISVGTLSSIFVCSPLYYELSKLGKKSAYKGAKGKKSNRRGPMPEESPTETQAWIPDAIEANDDSVAARPIQETHETPEKPAGTHEHKKSSNPGKNNNLRKHKKHKK